ncbi:hypothetical protein D9758_006174 [Tetrapyrgos nigripes]|uniref:Uncharacterized protein n=1 Tax=Tetrapyrgos nigripes TaxID=182062 RepID=A0A8H5GAT1_9AGAR|nr:hypothetical protein D9758_006174 [Tetrapyrgos nigripes]
MGSLLDPQLPYELKYSILTSVIAEAIHSVCLSAEDQKWEIGVLQTLSVVNKSFRSICISLCGRGLGGYNTTTGRCIASVSRRLSKLRRMALNPPDDEEVEQLHYDWHNLNPSNDSHNVIDCYILLISFRRFRKATAKSTTIEEFNKMQQLVITSSKLLSVACHHAMRYLGDVGGGLFALLSEVADQELILLDSSIRIVNLFHIVENALKFLDVIWKAQNRYGEELVSTMGIIDDGEEQACMDNVKTRLFTIHKSAVRYAEELALCKWSYVGQDEVLLHQLPRTLNILKRLVESPTCAKIDEANMKRLAKLGKGTGRDVGIEAKPSVFDLSESDEEETNADDNVTELVRSFCVLWTESMDDPKTTTAESTSEKFRVTHRALKAFGNNSGGGGGTSS